MEEKPIIFSSEMVRAILEGRKSQTRRVIPNEWQQCQSPEDEPEWFIEQCKYGHIGDRLWVRESLSVEIGATKSDIECGNFAYKANDRRNLWTLETGFRTIPSIHMPRFASRITLQIENVVVEKLQEITESEAAEEGVIIPVHEQGTVRLREGGVPVLRTSFKTKFIGLWDKINSPRGYGWDVNPWVWVITFKVVKK